MNIAPKNVLEMLKKASLSGYNKDCVIMSTNDGSYIISIDESQTIYSHSHCNESMGVATLGIGRVDILMKYLSGITSETITATVQDNRLVFTDGNTNFRYLLSDPASIRCQLEEKSMPTNGEDYDETFADCPFSIELSDEDRAFVSKMMGIARPRTITIKLSAMGRVTIVGGGENDHTFDRVVGTAKMADGTTAFVPMEINFYGESVKHVWDELTLGVAATMYLAADASAIAFIQDGVLFNLKPLND